MKKYLAFLVVMFAMLPAAAFADSIVFTPATVTPDSTDFQITGSSSSDSPGLSLYFPAGAVAGTVLGGGFPTFPYDNTNPINFLCGDDGTEICPFSDTDLGAAGYTSFLDAINIGVPYALASEYPAGVYTLVLFDGNQTDACDDNTSDLSDCESAPSFEAETTFTLSEGNTPGTLQQVVDNATTTFDQTTDPPLGDYLDWSATNFYDLFLGSGLAVLFYLRGWIVAILMIGALVYFAYRMFLFFRH